MNELKATNILEMRSAFLLPFETETVLKHLKPANDAFADGGKAFLEEWAEEGRA